MKRWNVIHKIKLFMMMARVFYPPLSNELQVSREIIRKIPANNEEAEICRYLKTGADEKNSINIIKNYIISCLKI
ncbi:MAG: hypothetical protein SRB1_02437 [Desulfobacteraceae bacterium Eth-SRB1]|nr:MAG: hypothetical protein SRB1_02437 [Desulfobacteraceae bacterium Eth-SRB1]